MYLTQTDLTLLQECELKFRLVASSQLAISSKGSDALNTGSIFHELREGKTQTALMQANPHLMENIDGIEAHFQLFQAKWAQYPLSSFKVIATEQVINEQFQRIPLKGIVDLIAQDQNGTVYFIDYKTTAQDLTRLREYYETLLHWQPIIYNYFGYKRYRKDFGGLIYILCKNKAPMTPEVLKKGELSQKKIDTTPDAYLQYAMQYHQASREEMLQKYDKILSTLLREGYREKFFQELKVNPPQGSLYDRMAYIPIYWDKARRAALEPIPSFGMHCQWCSVQNHCRTYLETMTLPEAQKDTRYADK